MIFLQKTSQFEQTNKPTLWFWLKPTLKVCVFYFQPVAGAGPIYSLMCFFLIQFLLYLDCMGPLQQQTSHEFLTGLRAAGGALITVKNKPLSPSLRHHLMRILGGGSVQL